MPKAIVRVFDALLWCLTFGAAPSLQAKRDLFRLLEVREELDIERWIEGVTSGDGAKRAEAHFVYTFMHQSGMPAGRTRATDRIVADLRVDRVFWRDWEYELDESFQEEFGSSPLKARALAPELSLSELVSALNSVRIRTDSD